MAYRGEIPSQDMAPVVGWDDFMRFVFDWQQSQHVALIGPTESGKSTLQNAILPKRKYVTIFVTKPRDRTLEAFGASGGYERIHDWPPRKGRGRRGKILTPEEMPKRLLWPDATRMTPETMEHQREVFLRAFHDIYGSGGWTTVWDEFWMMCSILGMEREARIMLQQARSNDISFVIGAQRPSRIPLEVFDQTTHLFFWRDNDEANLKRIGGIGWLDSNAIRYFVASLEPHQALYLNARRGWMYRTTAPELKTRRRKG